MTQRQDLKKSKLWWDFVSTYAADDAEIKAQVERCLDAQNKINERLIALAAKHTKLKLIVERSSTDGATSFLKQGADLLKYHSQDALAASFAADLKKSGLEVVQIVGIGE